MPKSNLGSKADRFCIRRPKLKKIILRKLSVCLKTYVSTGCRRLTNTSGIDLPDIFFSLNWTFFQYFLDFFGKFWDYSGNNLGHFWSIFGTILDFFFKFWESFGDFFGTFWEDFWRKLRHHFFQLNDISVPIFFLTDIFFSFLNPVGFPIIFNFLFGFFWICLGKSLLFYCFSSVFLSFS